MSGDFSTGAVSGVLIARLVFMCLLLALTVISTLFTALAFNEYGWMASGRANPGADTVMAISFVSSAVEIVACVLAIIYYPKAVGCAHSAKKAANGIVPGKPISMFVIVISFAVAGFGLINLLISLVASFSVLSFLSDLCQIAFYALIGVVLIQLRGRLKRIAAERASVMGYTGGYNSWPNDQK